MSLPKVTIAVIVTALLSSASTYMAVQSFKPTNISIPVITPSPAPEQKSDSQISSQLKEIKDELVKIRAEQRSFNQVLGSSTAISGQAVVASTKTSVEVYAEPVSFAKAIGKAVPGKVYSVIAKENSWYKIVLSDFLEGWVLASQMVFSNKSP